MIEKAMIHAQKYVAKNNELKPLSFFAYLIKGLTRNDNDILDFRPIIPAIEKEPGISAKLLAFASSAFYGPLGSNTVATALMRLGDKKSLQVLIALTLGEKFNSDMCEAFDLERYWTDALFRACTAPFIASSVTSPTNVKLNEWYTIVLMHNIGFQCLVQYEPKTMNDLLSTDDKLSANEYAEFGFSHRELAAALLAHWGLPDMFHRAIPHINNKKYRGDYWGVAAVISITRSQSLNASFDEEYFESLTNEWGVSPASALPAISTDQYDEALVEALGLAEIIFKG